MNAYGKKFLETLCFRFACKQFNPGKKISKKDFQTILEAGRLAPSSFGFEPWEYIVVQDMALREEIRAVAWGAQTQLPSASHVVVLLARKPEAMAPDSSYIQNTIMRETQKLPPEIIAARTEKYRMFLENDFALSHNPRAGFEWAARQSYIALSFMMMAAAFLGIDSCPIEGFQKYDLETLLAAKGILQTDDFGVACMAAFGYRDEGPKRPKTRRPEKDVIRWID